MHLGSRKIAALVLCCLDAAPPDAHAASRPAPPIITDVSGRADLVSGGDALLRIDLPARARRAHVRVTLDRRSVTRRFLRSGRRMDALLTGLKPGRNVLDVRLQD